jgi:hypothetical protein
LLVSSIEAMFPADRPRSHAPASMSSHRDRSSPRARSSAASTWVRP